MRRDGFLLQLNEDSSAVPAVKEIRSVASRLANLVEKRKDKMGATQGCSKYDCESNHMHTCWVTCVKHKVYAMVRDASTGRDIHGFKITVYDRAGYQIGVQENKQEGKPISGSPRSDSPDKEGGSTGSTAAAMRAKHVTKKVKTTDFGLSSSGFVEFELPRGAFRAVAHVLGEGTGKYWHSSKEYWDCEMQIPVVPGRMNCSLFAVRPKIRHDDFKQGVSPKSLVSIAPVSFKR